VKNSVDARLLYARGFVGALRTVSRQSASAFAYVLLRMNVVAARSAATPTQPAVNHRSAFHLRAAFHATTTANVITPASAK
jgi:hypothetical protein